MQAPIKIVIADDHEIFRKGFHVLLLKQKHIKIVGDAVNGEDLLQKVEKYKPDIVIMDIQMPVMDGVQATQKLIKKNPDLGIIALTMFNEDHLIIDMLEAGARGYILKNTNREELAQAVQAVFEGGTYLCNATSEKMTQMIATSQFNPVKKLDRIVLLQSEKDIIRLICKEYSSKQIASELGYTTRTVENYREKLMEKIGAKNAVGLAVFAIKNKIYTP